MIHGTNADTGRFSREAIELARDPKELFWIERASHVDFYDMEEYVSQAIAKLGGYEHADCRRHGRGFYLFGSGNRFPSFFMAATHSTMPGMENMPAHLSVPVYFEAASVIIALILLGRMLEARAKGQTGAAIKKLVGLQAKTARVIRDDKEVEVETEAVMPGDIVLVRPGEKFRLTAL